MVNFTREPIVESVISPREGCKLAVRNSKGVGQEEYFVDALEVVSFGSAVFYRSLERPKNFLLPASDYEVLEVRETRMVLKHVLEPEKKVKKEAEEERAPKEHRRERRRSRRRTRREVSEEEGSLGFEEAEAGEEPKEASSPEKKESPEVALASMPPPPTGLISESIDRYKEMLVPLDAEEPELIPPVSEEDIPVDTPVETPKGAGVFSPASFLRKLTGREEETD